ncbi:hypothetical protein B0H14DRAFT_2594778 [Mycena olivaceomarginata]|nr:hypothetical protein B0H14DRAFT_2594778 [Mycena olivaceomarginata]
MTGKREGHPCCGLHMSDEGVGGAGGKTGYPLLHSYWIAFDRVGVWINLTLEQAGQIYWSAFDGDGIQVVQEGGRRNEHPLLQATLLSEVLEAEQYRKAGGAGDTHVEGHN